MKVRSALTQLAVFGDVGWMDEETPLVSQYWLGGGHLCGYAAVIPTTTFAMPRWVASVHADNLYGGVRRCRCFPHSQWSSVFGLLECHCATKRQWVSTSRPHAPSSKAGGAIF